MSEQQQRLETALNDSSLILFTPTPGVEGTNGKKPWARLHHGWYKNKYQFSVFTGDPADRANENGWIRHEFSVKQFRDLMQMWKEVNASTELNTKQVCNVEGKQWSKTENKSIQMNKGSVVIGKKDGCVYLAATSWDKARPKIMFTLGEDRMHHYVKSDGTPVSNEEISVRSSISLQQSIEQIVEHLIVTAWVPEERKDRGNNNSGNNNSRSGGSSGSSESSSKGSFDEMDDDVPF